MTVVTMCSLALKSSWPENCLSSFICVNRYRICTFIHRHPPDSDYLPFCYFSYCSICEIKRWTRKEKQTNKKKDGQTDSLALVLPEFALERVDLAVHAVNGLGGFIQLPLQLPAGSCSSLRLLLWLLQLPLQLFHAGIRLFCLVTNRKKANWSFLLVGDPS